MPVRYRVVTSTPGTADPAWTPQSSVLPSGLPQWTWDRRNVSAPPKEDAQPSEFDPVPWVQFTTFHDWGAVARAQRQYFALPDPLPDNIVRQARTLTADIAPQADGTPDTTEAALRILRFVQDDVRYLSVSVGRHSHVPHPPSQVLDQRFGDCKDKVYLLVALLRAVQIEARPVLVDSEGRGAVSALLPSPMIFDHVIGQIRVGGRWIWVDPTESMQGGTLTTQTVPDFGLGLVLDDATTELTAIEQPPLDGPTIEVVNAYRIAEGTGATELVVDTVYRGDPADVMRHDLGRTSREERRHQYLEFYGTMHPGIEAVGPLEIQDDRRANRLTVHETYRIPSDGQRDGLELKADAIARWLRVPQVTRRTSPLAVPDRLWVHQTVRAQLGWNPNLTREVRHVEDEAFTFDSLLSSEANVVRHDLQFRSRGHRSVAPNDVAKHLEHVRAALGHVVFGVPERQADPSSEDAESSSESGPRPTRWAATWVTLLVLGGLAMVVAGGRAAYERTGKGSRRRAFKRGLVPGRGESADQAIAVADEGAAHANFSASRCLCGSGLRPESTSPVRLGAATVHVVRARCHDCGQTVRRHYVYTTVNPASASYTQG